MKIGFVYAGQGSQRVGMGADIYGEFEEFRTAFDAGVQAAAAETGVDIKDLCFNGPIEKLSLTEYTQPAMVAFAAGVTEVLKANGIIPEYALGLSLGEYSALYAAEALDAAEVTRLVAKRGRFMTEAAKGLEVGMAAVLGTDRDVIAGCCEKARKETGKVVSAANYNCPGQIVISGEKAAVDRCCELLKEAGTKRIVPLNVSGPFHTALMKKAGDMLAREFESVGFKKPVFDVIFNATGRTLEEGQTIESLLEKQVQSLVYLEDSIRLMGEKGVDTFVEIGPGKVIGGFIKKTLQDVRILGIDTAEDLRAVIAQLKG